MDQVHHKRGGSYTLEQLDQEAADRAAKQAAPTPPEKPASEQADED